MRFRLTPLLHSLFLLAWLSGATYAQSWTCGDGSCTTTGSIGVGTSNQFTVSSSGALVAGGGISSPQTTHSERFGQNAAANGNSATAVGYNASANTDLSLALGAGSIAGDGSNNAFVENTAVGVGSVANAQGNTAIGFDAHAKNDYSVAVGAGSNAGDGTNLSINENTAVGFGSAATGGGATAVGFDAAATGGLSIAIGGAASGPESIAVRGTAGSDYALSVGWGSNVQGEASIGIGGFTSTGSTHTGSMAFGYQAATRAAGQLVFGGLYPVSDIYFGKGVYSTSPVGIAINANGGRDDSPTSPTPNIAGGNLTLAGGKGSGTAPGGDIILATSDPSGIGGTSLDALSTKVIVKDNGRVGIGTTSPQHLLSVAGTIGAQELVVVSSGADYVFDPNYQLAPLSDVSAFVKENHHLPGIPSAAEVREKGLDVGEMQTRLLEKVEELTLRMIAQQQKIDELEQQIEEKAR